MTMRRLLAWQGQAVPPPAALLIALMLIAPALWIFRFSLSGDATIGFTFSKNFFRLPFSFQPGTVSFGASSPLFILLQSPIHALFGSHWLAVSQTLSCLLIVGGVVALNAALEGDLDTQLLLILLTVLDLPLLTTAAELYETPLVFFLASLVLFAYRRRRYHLAIFLSGLFYLARPELVLVTIAFQWYLLASVPDRRRLALVAMVSLLPAGLYHAYIFSYTGELIPSSVYARAINSLENQRPWWQRLTDSLGLLTRRENVIYPAGALGVAAGIATRGWKNSAAELLLIAPLVFVYTVMPPGVYAPRFLLPIVPPMMLLSVSAIRRLSKDRRWAGVLLLSIVALLLLYHKESRLQRRYDYDTLLLKDLAQRLNPLLRPDDAVFLYEIQGQYYLNAFCYSLDGVVGNQIFPVLRGKRTFEDFIRDHRELRFIVTMNAFNYRNIFRGTMLPELYLHDLASGVGDTTVIRGTKLRKVLTNPAFADPTQHATRGFDDLNVGATLRVYNETRPRWAGHHIMWNSVYEVLRSDAVRWSVPWRGLYSGRVRADGLFVSSPNPSILFRPSTV
jgi:hypothetical protein